MNTGTGTGPADGGTQQPTIVFTQDGILPNPPFPDTTQKFDVQWQAVNSSTIDSQGFTDLLVITKVSSCSDDADSTVVYNSQDPQYGANPQDFMEGPLTAGTVGNVMKTNVGPFTEPGWYRLTVTLDVGRSNTTTYNCKEITQGANDTPPN